MNIIHDNGVVHRDLKPENIMVDAEDKIKLIDFGIAGDSAARRLTYANFTATLGTPNYISPEQVKGKRGDGRSDIYSSGRDPLRNADRQAALHRLTPMQAMNDRLLNHPTPPAVLDPSISPQLQEVIYRALERDPKNRYAKAHEFAHDLEHLDQVGVEDRPEMHNWQKRKSQLPAQDSLLRRTGADSGGDSAAHDADCPSPLSSFLDLPNLHGFFMSRGSTIW